jgi:hypothetical protein
MTRQDGLNHDMTHEYAVHHTNAHHTTSRSSKPTLSADLMTSVLQRSKDSSASSRSCRARAQLPYAEYGSGDGSQAD